MSTKVKHLKGAGYKVKCPSCCGVFHKTTDLFDSNVRPNGASVELINPWVGWGWQAFDGAHATCATLCSQMNCPGCTAPLAPSGRLSIIEKRKRKPRTVSEMNNKKVDGEAREYVPINKPEQVT